jgi:outer membrane protein
MTIKTCMITLFCMASGLAGAPALHADGATLQDCFKDALVQSETLAEAHEDLVQDEERYKQAIGAIMPTIGLNYTYMRQDDHSYVFPDTNPVNQSTFKATADQPLFRGFREFEALDLVKDSIAATKEANRWAAMQLYQDVSQAFFLVLTLEKDRDLVDDEVKLFDERIKDLQQRQAIGRSQQSEVLTAQADQALLMATGVQTRLQVTQARELLAFLTGKDVDQALDASGALPATAGDLDAYLKAAQDRPDLTAARSRVEAAKQQVAIIKGGNLPSADIVGNWYFTRPGVTDNVNWDLSFVATLPIFQGFTVPSQTRQAESQVKQAQLDLQRQQRQVDNDIHTGYVTVAGDLAQIAALQQAYDLSDKSYEALKHDYTLGLSTNLDVLQALLTSRDAQRSLEHLRNAARNDEERLESSAGLRLNLLGDK